jgi:hypothetical protein
MRQALDRVDPRMNPIMIDIVALVVAMFLIFVVGNQRFQFEVGKYKRVKANGHFRVIFVFPLGATLSIVAIFRLIGHYRPDQCATCSRVSYDLLSTLYPGWALSLMGIFGVKSFAKIKERMTRAFVIIAIICGPFLMWVGFHDIVLWVRR